jgi:hypothetical protein
MSRIAAHMGVGSQTGFEAAATSASRVVSQQPPVTVLVTGAAGQIAYSLVFLVAQVRRSSTRALHLSLQKKNQFFSRRDNTSW